MTKEIEEQAEAYIMREDVVTENDRVPFDNGYGWQTVSFEDEVKQAFKDGAKWGIEHEWHDLRKNPNNLPKDCNTFVLNQDGEKCRKYSNLWIDIYGHCVTVIAWCELPQFKEKE